MKLSLREEKRLWKKGYKCVVGLDEAGRGPLVGPVVAAAVMVKNPKSQTLNSKQIPSSKFQISNSSEFRKLEFGISFRISNLGFRISELRDSKKLSPQQREQFYKVITRSPFIEWGIGRVSEKVIDRVNILEATKLAMKGAVEKLKVKNKKLKIDYLILDGRMRLDLPISQKSIVKADEKVFSCAAASIIAKVTRDKIMMRYHKKYPRYGFDKHKGYPTRFHKKMLKKYGFCEIHRKTFRPVKNMLK